MRCERLNSRREDSTSGWLCLRTTLLFKTLWNWSHTCLFCFLETRNDRLLPLLWIIGRPASLPNYSVMAIVFYLRKIDCDTVSERSYLCIEDTPFANCASTNVATVQWTVREAASDKNETTSSIAMTSKSIGLIPLIDDSRSVPFDNL